MHFILCISFYAFHSMRFILCISFYAIHSMHFILCISFYAFHSMHFILYFILCISFYAFHFVFYSMFSIMCMSFFALLCISFNKSNFIHFIGCIVFNYAWSQFIPFQDRPTDRLILIHFSNNFENRYIFDYYNSNHLPH